MFASRTNWKLTENQLAQKLTALHNSGIKLLDLTESNPTKCAFAYPSEILRPLPNKSNLEYTPDPKGIKLARNAITKYYKEKGVRIGPEQIILTASTSEAYSYLFRLLANPGDHVLSPSPSYPLFDFLSDINDVILDRYLLREEADWSIDFESLTSKCQAKTKAIILVHPNNPTGSYVKPNELQKLNRLAQQKEVAIICDEVFLDYALNERPSGSIQSLAGNKEALTFVLSGISKIIGFPQMKLGWIVVNGPNKLVETALKRLEMVSDTFLSVNSPAQNSLPHWLSMRQKIQSQIIKRIAQNKKALSAALQNSNHCQILNADGGWCTILRLPQSIDEEACVLELLEKEHVLAHPGYFFDFENGSHLVLSLLPPPTIFKKGIFRIAHYLYQNESV